MRNTAQLASSFPGQSVYSDYLFIPLNPCLWNSIHDPVIILNTDREPSEA